MAAASDPGQQPLQAGQQQQQPLAPRPIADEELALLAAYTGETDLAALRRHVEAVWRRACSGDAPVYLCIRAIMFLEPRVKRHPRYERALQLVRAARAAAAADGGGGGGPLWVDVGAAVGTDVRQLRLDGLAQGEVLALDVPDSQHYWNIGLELYRDAARPPCRALFGDITDDAVLPPTAAAASASGAGGSPGPSGGCDHGSSGSAGDDGGSDNGTGIPALAGTASVVSCIAVLHCLGQEAVERLLRKMFLLLRPGGMLIGNTLGAATPREWQAAYQAGHTRWLHSVDSLRAALEAAGFEAAEVAPDQWWQREAVPTMQPIMESHVGSQAGLEERRMLEFSAVRPAAQSG